MEASIQVMQTESRIDYTETHTTSDGHGEIKKSKKKSTKKNGHDNNISVSKSSEKFYKKMQTNGVDSNPECCMCQKPVFAMERIKAEKRTFHKECFRCCECKRNLTVETYQSHEGFLYCKQHFKNLFAPKVVEDDDQPHPTQKKHQLIICESNPIELPPDVVRASDKPDLGLEELSSLDVKSRFEMFEKKSTEGELKPTLEEVTPRERSTALLSKLAKFKSKGMDVGVSDEYLNGVPIEPSSSEGEEDEDSVLKKSYKHTVSREQPVSFCNMSEIVGKFETGDLDSAERRQERKQEIQNIRSRLFLGKQARIKEQYEQSVAQSELSKTSAEKIAQELELENANARSIKEKFETGDIYQDKGNVHTDKVFELDQERARSIKDKFESGQIYQDKGNVHTDKSAREFDLDQERARAIKDKFESGQIYQDKGYVHTDKVAREFDLDQERARVIKDKFESGQIYQDKGISTEKLARELDLDHERARAIKEKFERGEIFQEKGNISADRLARELDLDHERARDIKEKFESGVIFQDKENSNKSAREIDLDHERARAIKDMFENGEIYQTKAITSSDKIARELDLDNERARSIKQKFENGEIFMENGKEQTRNREIDDETLFNEGIGKKSRTIFLELDANAKGIGAPLSPPIKNEVPKRKEKPFVPKDLVRSEDRVDDVKIETSDITNRFKFFETYKPKEERREFRMTPPREGEKRKSPSPEVYRDPNVIRSDDTPVETGMVQQRQTASRMISVFQTLEQKVNAPDEYNGPKPLKSFTPPPPGATRATSDSEESEDENSEELRQRRYMQARQRDEALQQAQAAARAKNLRNRFENWSESEQQTQEMVRSQHYEQRPTQIKQEIVIERTQSMEDDSESQVETARSLREKFENLKVQQSQVTKTFAAQKVNRFV